ncbi:hypothetical protein KCU65_g9366, partial [Aureobasidium melanogenum]
MGLGAILEVVGIFCLASRLVDWPNPICAFGGEDTLSIETDNPAQALKERLETMQDNLGIEIPDGPIGQAEAERIMSTAISVMKAQATTGPDAMSQDEMAEFLARLDIPKPTPFSTVAATLPTERSTIQPTHHFPEDPEEETNWFLNEQCCGGPFQPRPCPCGLKPTTMLTVAASVPTKRSEPDEVTDSDHISEEEPKKTADEKLTGSRLDAWRRGKHCPLWTPFCWKRSTPDAISDADHSSEEELKKAADKGPEAAFIFCIPTPFAPICL